jgi:hypothetical protein
LATAAEGGLITDSGIALSLKPSKGFFLGKPSECSGRERNAFVAPKSCALRNAFLAPKRYAIRDGLRNIFVHFPR